ncbi:MAG: permease-like cell division protein FtsX [Candidatus Gracilibacteria bacterium]|nr:permease-like cell division protein FtsX [Candidatus Gracilibacteria bacterium]
MLYRLLKYSIKNILRNKFLSFSSVLVLALLMFFINILMIVYNLSDNLIEVINSKLTISLYLKDDYPKESIDVQKLINDISMQTPNIKIEYKSKDEVLEEMRKKDEELVSIIRSQNPLPATINLSNIKIEEYEKLNYIIESKLYILSDFKTSSIYDYRTQYLKILKIIGILKTLKLALYIIIGIFLLSIFVITYSIIGNFIYHYRDEISITKLVGGSNSFIYGPFVFQGIIYSIIGFFLSTNIFLLILNNISIVFDQSKVKEYVVNSDLSYILFIQLIMFIIIGSVSSFLSSGKYMK